MLAMNLSEVPLLSALKKCCLSYLVQGLGESGSGLVSEDTLAGPGGEPMRKFSLLPVR